MVDSEANHFVDIRSSGLCELSYSTLLTVPCNFDFNNFPFDEQTCTFKVTHISQTSSVAIWIPHSVQIGSSLYDINEVSISQAIDFVIDEPSLMPSGYSFVSNTIQQQVVYFPGFDRSYDQIAIDLNIRRRSTYFVRLINFPGLILAFLTLTIFLLPPAASERIAYGTTDVSFCLATRSHVLMIYCRCTVTLVSIPSLDGFRFLHSQTTRYDMAMDGPYHLLRHLFDKHDIGVFGGRSHAFRWKIFFNATTANQNTQCMYSERCVDCSLGQLRNSSSFCAS